jgi:hypothetical protein
MTQVIALDPTVEAEKEEAAREKITDEAFQPAGPTSVAPADYDAGTSYSKGAIVSEEGQAYRSLTDENEGNAPSADTDNTNWTPVSQAFFPLQNPDYSDTHTSFVRGL